MFLLLRGWSVGRTVAFIATLAALTCGAALASYFTNNDLFALAMTSTVFVALALARVFGHAEVALIASRSAFARANRISAWAKGVRRIQKVRCNCRKMQMAKRYG